MAIIIAVIENPASRPKAGPAVLSGFSREEGLTLKISACLVIKMLSTESNWISKVPFSSSVIGQYFLSLKTPLNYKSFPHQISFRKLTWIKKDSVWVRL